MRMMRMTMMTMMTTNKAPLPKVSNIIFSADFFFFLFFWQMKNLDL